jgi:peptidoglycan/xylan/chitin deacetylase (PgdA/CDA1 family)
MIKRIRTEGHIIGNHTYSHKNLVRLTDEEIKTEVLKTEELILKYLSFPKLLRPPFGAIDVRVNKILSELGYLPVLWNVDTMDWKIQNDDWVKNAVELLGEYNIILMHDVRETTMQNLPLLINEIRKKKNFEFIKYL